MGGWLPALCRKVGQSYCKRSGYFVSLLGNDNRLGKSLEIVKLASTISCVDASESCRPQNEVQLFEVKSIERERGLMGFRIRGLGLSRQEHKGFAADHQILMKRSLRFRSVRRAERKHIKHLATNVGWFLWDNFVPGKAPEKFTRRQTEQFHGFRTPSTAVVRADSGLHQRCRALASSLKPNFCQGALKTKSLQRKCFR